MKIHCTSRQAERLPEIVATIIATWNKDGVVKVVSWEYPLCGQSTTMIFYLLVYKAATGCLSEHTREKSEKGPWFFMQKTPF